MRKIFALTWWAPALACVLVLGQAGDPQAQTCQPSQVPPGWSDVFFPSADIGFAVGYGGVILKTGNGGATWMEKYRSPNRGFYSVHFPNRDTGFASGTSNFLVKTTDGGETWSQVTTPQGVFDHGYSLRFQDGKTGFVAGIYRIYDTIGVIRRTMDGGITWNTSLGTPSSLHGLHFPNRDTGYAVGSVGVAYKTINGGDSWTKLNTGTSQWLYPVFFLDGLRGFAAGEAGLLLRTLDGGAAWTPLASGTGAKLNAIHFPNRDTGYALGNNNRYSPVVLKTIDGGATWKNISLPDLGEAELSAIHFYSAQAGTALGTRASDGAGIILQTTDGGGLWTLRCYTPIPVGLNTKGYRGITPNFTGLKEGLHWWTGRLYDLKGHAAPPSAASVNTNMPLQ